MSKITPTKSPGARGDEGTRQRSAHANDGDGSNDVVPPNLSTMPAALLVRICQYLVAGEMCDSSPNLPALLALERTSRSLHDVFGKEETWAGLFPIVLRLWKDQSDVYQNTLREAVFIPVILWRIKKIQKSSRDVLLQSMGGADGVRRVVGELLARMCPDDDISQLSKFEAVFRGDSISYLTEVIQAHVVSRLGRAHHMVLRRRQHGDEYPQIRADDLRLVAELLSDQWDTNINSLYNSGIAHGNQYFGMPMGWLWPTDNCSGDEVLGTDDRVKMVRALACRAGVVKMSGEAFSLVAEEVLRCMGSIVAHAFEVSKHMYRHRANDDDSAYEDNYVGSYFANYSPPIREDESGKLRCVIIAKQIEDATVKLGMKPLLGFKFVFGACWAASHEDGRTEEVEEAMGAYFDDGNPWESESDSKSEPESESSFMSLMDMESFDSDAENNVLQGPDQLRPRRAAAREYYR